MEQWQRRVIKTHLPELVDLTSCNTELLTRLFSKEILTDEEIHEIDVATLNPKKKAYKLYGLLVTRTNAYHLFLAACKEIRQTGVVSILQKGEYQHNLLAKGECNVVHPCPMTGTTPTVNILHKSPLLKTRSTKTKESPITSNFDNNLSEHHNLNVPKSSNVKSSYKALHKSSVLCVDKIPSPEDNDTQSSSIKGAFPSVHKLSQNPHQEITGSLEKCHTSKSKTKITADDASSNANSDTLSSITNKRQLGLKTDVSNKHHGNISQLDSKLTAININIPDNEGRTILHRALADRQSLDAIKSLIDNNADYKLKDKLEDGVLHFAVRGGNKEEIQYLISLGLNVNDKNNDGNTPLHLVKETRPMRYFELTKLLLDNGADLYSKNKDGDTLAHLMATCEFVSCDNFKFWVSAMIENGHAHLFTIRGRFGSTPLLWSMQRRDLDLETIKLIIESAKLDINQRDCLGNNILHLARDFGRSLDTIKSLVELGADWKGNRIVVNSKHDRHDRSILHSAVEGSNKEAFLHFKSLGADVNAIDKYGRTPLHHVIRTRSKDYLEMTMFLLENGANLNAKDNKSKTLDDCMSSSHWISAEKYRVWKEGMIQLGQATFFKESS